MFSSSKSLISLAILILMAATGLGAGPQSDPATALIQPPVSESEITAAQQFGQSMSIAQWLGPMAPIALSPFFGITCLSGMSLFGGEWISKGNPLVGANSPLHNPAVLWIFLGLTILTSVPRMTKVSKPFAQAVDRLETWSGIITMLVMKVLISSASGTPEVTVSVPGVAMIGIPADVLMMIAATVNIFVINAVKFFFEILVWLTPVPFLDAIFELCNKTVCAALMAVYAWSPIAATALNATIFVVAFVIFGWAHRRQVFFRTMLFDAAFAMFSKQVPGTALTVFPVAGVGGIKARAKCTLQRTRKGWTLTSRPLLSRTASIGFPAAAHPILQVGVLSNQLTFSNPAVSLTFSRLYNAELPHLAAMLGATLSDAAVPQTNARVEFA